MTRDILILRGEPCVVCRYTLRGFVCDGRMCGFVHILASLQLVIDLR